MVLPIILIVLSLALAIAIVIRKLPQLSLFDVETLPEVQQGKTKEILLKKRAEKQAGDSTIKMRERFKPLIAFFAHVQKEFRVYVSKVQRNVHHESVRAKRKHITPKNVQTVAKDRAIENEIEEKKEPEPVVPSIAPVVVENRDELLSGARSDMEIGSYIEAEKKCIAIIKKDAQCVEAYFILADVYMKQDQVPEAQQTYEFILQLDPRSELAYVRLGEIAEERGELHKAVDYYQEALLINDNVAKRFSKLFELLAQLEEFGAAYEAAKQAAMLEPENPKYLDNLVEASIIVGDKNSAEAAYDRLRLVNPENNKLEAFKQRIRNMH